MKEQDMCIKILEVCSDEWLTISEKKTGKKKKTAVEQLILESRILFETWNCVKSLGFYLIINKYSFNIKDYKISNNLWSKTTNVLFVKIAWNLIA